MTQRKIFPCRKFHFMTLVISFNYFSALGAKWAIIAAHLLHSAGLLRLFIKSSEAFHIFFRVIHSDSTHIFIVLWKNTHTFLFPSSYQIIWDNCEDENTVAPLFKILPKAHRDVVRSERRDYGSVTSDFSLLVLIASIVWKASCRKGSTHGYYTQSYYPWQKNWDEKREITVKELLPRDGITQSLQEGWSPSDWRRLRNSTFALVVRQSPVTSPLCVCVCVWVNGLLCGDDLCIIWACICVILLLDLFTSGSYFLCVTIYKMPAVILYWPLMSLLPILLLSLFSTNKFMLAR